MCLFKRSNYQLLKKEQSFFFFEEWQIKWISKLPYDLQSMWVVIFVLFLKHSWPPSSAAMYCLVPVFGTTMIVSHASTGWVPSLFPWLLFSINIRVRLVALPPLTKSPRINAYGRRSHVPLTAPAAIGSFVYYTSCEAALIMLYTRCGVWKCRFCY